MGQWSDLAKAIMGVFGLLLVTAIVAVWRLVANKVSKPEFESELEQAVKSIDNDVKSVNERLDKALVIFGQAASKTDLIRDLSTATIRADDKDIRVQRDIVELKSDLKALAEKVTLVDKKLDELPSRVASLEARHRGEN